MAATLQSPPSMVHLRRHGQQHTLPVAHLVTKCYDLLRNFCVKWESQNEKVHSAAYCYRFLLLGNGRPTAVTGTAGHCNTMTSHTIFITKLCSEKRTFGKSWYISQLLFTIRQAHIYHEHETKCAQLGANHALNINFHFVKQTVNWNSSYNMYSIQHQTGQ